MVLNKLIYKMLAKALSQTENGSLQIELPDQTSQTFGHGDLVTKIVVKKWSVFSSIIFKGDIGFTEQFIEGNIEIDDLTALIKWACENDEKIEKAIYGSTLGTIGYFFKHLSNSNSEKQAKKNIMAHYDLGNSFYKLWLDSSMTYSSAIFKSADEDLTSAQLNKYDRLIDLLNIKPTDHVLEIGCGWGGFFTRAVERTGCKVTAVMNSPEQAKHNRELILAKNLQNHVTLIETDYRNIKGQFDKVVSIEMIEAVGEAYWHSYFEVVERSLKSGGKAIIQGITIQERFFEKYRYSPDFIKNYIFPGGMLLTNKIFAELPKKFNLTLTNQFEFGHSYAKTLKLWRERYFGSIAHVRKLGFDSRFDRLWNMYLSYCEGAFSAERINVGQYLFEKTI